MNEILTQLKTQILEAHWIDLQFHLKQGNVFLLPSDVDIALVGEAIVTDQVNVIQAWLQSGHLQQLTNPSLYKREELVRILIVKPFVLVQECETDKEDKQ